MPEQIIEDNWPQGWIPSSSAQADFGAPSTGLLRMDNLTLDEKGSLRLINRPTNLGNSGASINSIFGAYMANKKYRYVYGADGRMLRNYGGAASLTTFDKVLGTGGATTKAGFLTALGHTIGLAGTIQIKDRGDITWPITIPVPVAPTLTNQAATKVQLSNLDGGGNYTNWTNVSTTGYNNAGTQVAATTIAGLASFKTVYGTAIDTTNFGVTGEDTPSDLFTFNFEIDDPSLFTVGVIAIQIELMCTDPGAGVVTDEFVASIYFETASTPDGFFMPSISGGVKYTLSVPRSAFARYGTSTTLGWNTIKAAYITISTNAPTPFTFSTFFVGSGPVTGDQQYVVVEFNDTGQFVEYSVKSAQVDVTASVNYVLVDRSGAAVDAQANGIITFRNNTILGQFIAVNIQTGAYGFTPVSFIDKLSDTDALLLAVNDATRVLQFYRTQLPTTLIGGIFFASRVIYLTTSSFLPSYPLDFGSYDSRFVYELNSTNNELCLFIAPLSVGTFIVATTVDFYQVTGTFNPISTTNADGSITTILDVNIVKLGISDPSVSSSFREVEGSILYMSATGLRSMSNGVSTLLNTSTDLLYRNENRYGFPPVALQPNDLSLIGITSSGSRVYVALPFSNGINSILVSTYNPPLPAELRGANYWRPIILAAQCLYREQDGTVIYGDSGGNVASLESSFTGSLQLDFLTQFNYGQHPTESKSFGSLLLYVDTGGVDLTLTVNGLQEDGTVVSIVKTINANGAKVLAIDVSGLIDCIATQLQITGVTTGFQLNYAVLVTVQEYPPITFYALVPFSNLGKDTLKKLSKWGFVIDTLNGAVTAKVTADNKVISSDIDHSNEPQGITTEFWYNHLDVAALDWQLEVIAPTGMHFYKFMPPDVLQVYPPGRLLDQVGPLDLDLQGIVFGLRIRCLNLGITIHYDVLDNDVIVYSNDIATTNGLDTTYIEKFPKGVNTSVCRILISSPTLYYRSSLEVEVRTTGKDTEPGTQWVKINAK